MGLQVLETKIKYEISSAAVVFLFKDECWDLCLPFLGLSVTTEDFY